MSPRHPPPPQMAPETAFWSLCGFQNQICIQLTDYLCVNAVSDTISFKRKKKKSPILISSIQIHLIAILYIIISLLDLFRFGVLSLTDALFDRLLWSFPVLANWGFVRGWAQDVLLGRGLSCCCPSGSAWWSTVMLITAPQSPHKDQIGGKVLPIVCDPGLHMKSSGKL